jgi:hypothetical protein
MMDIILTSSVNITNHGVFLNGKQVVDFSEENLRDKKLEFAYRTLGEAYPKFFKMDTQSKLGWLAAELIIKDTQALHGTEKNNIALILSNQSASLDTDTLYQASLLEQKEDFLPSPAVFVYTLPNIVAGEICIRHGLKGENNFLISEKFDAELLVNYTEALFAEDLCKAAIVGWIDVYQDELRAFLASVEIKQTGSSTLNVNTENLNYLFQTIVL